PVTTPPVTTPDVPVPPTGLLGTTLAQAGGFDPDVLVPVTRTLAADSIARAAALLQKLQEFRASLADQRVAKLAEIDNADAETAKAKDERDQARRARVARALQMYRGTSTAEQVFPAAQTLDQLREMKLITDADISTREQIDALGKRLRDLKDVVTNAQARINELDTQNYLVGFEIANVQAKIAGLSAAGAQAPAAPGPDPAAILARRAQALLDTASATPDPAASAAYRSARHELAVQVAKEAGRIDPAALDAEWAKVGRLTMKAVLFALSQAGKAYVYATAGPDTYDCSGLTMRAWAEGGLGLQHFSGAQLAVGAPVAPNALAPGDLLAYGPAGGDHVTFYIGQNLVVEAKGRAYGVVIDRARTDGDWYAGASRVAPALGAADIPQP
ncbi:MAG TPA: NlpC/P60 family protein, partial [Acidimicrobiia bacterium]|nr:NlpC/P60 family protein [Acidimicrobiia bacterium]